jgi:hypothetical protein
MRMRSFEGTSPTAVPAGSTPARGATPSSPQVQDGGAAQIPAPAMNDTVTPAESNIDTSAAARARDARYQQLLHAAPLATIAPNATPVAQGGVAPIATVPKPNPPSLVERAVKPIASALGISRSNPSAQGMSKPPSTQPSKGSGDEGATKDPNNPNNERDEDSDVMPPRLLGADFIPPVVQDGEATTFTVAAIDDISGVKSISGVVVSPSGAQQGFACQSDGLEGSNRFISRLTVPKEAAEGQWVVKYLSLADNAGNTTNLQYGQNLPPTASFKVISSASDSKGPTLKAIWLGQQAMTAGEKNEVFVQADDDKSGVSLVSGVFVSPKKQARIGFGCRLGANNIWECPLNPPSCLECGGWTLEQVQLQDKANNMTTVRGDNPLVAQLLLDMSGKECDQTLPVLVSLRLEPQVVSNAEGGVIRATAEATDDQCGVASLSGVAMPPASESNTRVYIAFRPVTEGGNIFTGEIVVPKHAPSGMWTIGWVQVLDKGHNLKAYTAGDPVLAQVTFRVE